MIEPEKNPLNKKNPTFSLIDLHNEELGEVVHINAGCRATQRLSGLGITPGTVIKRLSSAPFRGPIQIEVRKTRLAIGRGLASKIFLKERSL